MLYVWFMIFVALSIKLFIDCDWEYMFRPKVNNSHSKYPTERQMMARGNIHGLRRAKRQMRRMWR